MIAPGRTESLRSQWLQPPPAARWLAIRPRLVVAYRHGRQETPGSADRKAIPALFAGATDRRTEEAFGRHGNAGAVSHQAGNRRVPGAAEKNKTRAFCCRKLGRNYATASIPRAVVQRPLSSKFPFTVAEADGHIARSRNSGALELGKYAAHATPRGLGILN